jgi:hypothetical protein
MQPVTEAPVVPPTSGYYRQSLAWTTMAAAAMAAVGAWFL